MSKSKSSTIAAAAAAAAVFAVSFRPIIWPYLRETCMFTERDASIGEIPIQSIEELTKTYQGKSVLIVGGTRGVGLGTAIILSQCGAKLTIVGRSEASGKKALAQLANQENHSYLAGNIGTVAQSMELVDKLEAHPTKFDYLVVTAAIFPNWSGSQQNDDGIDACFAIGVVGRYILYANLKRFMNFANGIKPRVLNVMAPAGKMMKKGEFIKRDLIEGKRDAKDLFEAVLNFGGGNDLMMFHVTSSKELSEGVTFVSTHPGMLVTDLHRNQGLFMDVMETVFCALDGFTIEQAGQRQASTLASPQLKQQDGSLSLVTYDMQGRVPGAAFDNLQEDEDYLWLKAFLKKHTGY